MCIKQETRLRDCFSFVNLPACFGKLNVLTQPRLDQQKHHLIEDHTESPEGHIGKGHILQAWTLAEKGE